MVIIVYSWARVILKSKMFILSGYILIKLAIEGGDPAALRVVEKEELLLI